MAGLLDYLETPQGAGLLSAVASYAANARRGTPVNNIGRGLAGGLAGYQSAQQGIVDAENRKSEDAYRQVMMQAQMMNAQTAAENARVKAEQAAAKGRAVEAGKADLSGLVKTHFPGYEPELTYDDEFGYDIGNFRKVGTDDSGAPILSDMTIPSEFKVSEKPFMDKSIKLATPQQEIDIQWDKTRKALGWSQEQMEGVRSLPPKEAAKIILKGYERMRMPAAFAAKDVLAKERAMAAEMGMPLGQYLREKADKSGVNVNVAYGQPMAATDSSGNPVFIRPPMKVNEPPVIMPGFTPPEKPTEAESKSATFHQQMNTARKEIENIEKDIDVSNMLEQADIALAGGMTNPLSSAPAQRYRQAQEQWAEAFLRIKTGAAATQDEVDRNIRTFFPQIGDSAAVIEQKRRMREKAEQDVKAMGGTATRRIERQQTAPAKTMAPQPAKPEADSFNMLPNAKQYDNRTVTDSQTGKRYKSVNGKWVEVK